MQPPYHLITISKLLPCVYLSKLLLRTFKKQYILNLNKNVILLHAEIEDNDKKWQSCHDILKTMGPMADRRLEAMIRAVGLAAPPPHGQMNKFTMDMVTW